MSRNDFRASACGPRRVIRHMFPWVASTVIAMTPACTIGRYYTGSPLLGEPSALVEGQSTKADVLRQFGPPTTVMHQTDGDVFIYSYRQENTSTFRLQDPFTRISWFSYSRDLSRRDTVLVIFDYTGLVRSVAVERRVEELPPL